MVIINMRHFVDKLQKGFSLFSSADHHRVAADDEELLEVATMVAEDVKEGHFVVFAVKGEETQRFVVDLRYLTNPAFLRLLELAKEEYGFKQKGALKVPCRPHELQTILDQNRC
ncbi:hypothetical protein ACOSQ4_030082 [Xanthoceras sorbifolium]